MVSSTHGATDDSAGQSRAAFALAIGLTLTFGVSWISAVAQDDNGATNRPTTSANESADASDNAPENRPATNEPPPPAAVEEDEHAAWLAVRAALEAHAALTEPTHEALAAIEAAGLAYLDGHMAGTHAARVQRVLLDVWAALKCWETLLVTVKLWRDDEVLASVVRPHATLAEIDAFIALDIAEAALDRIAEALAALDAEEHPSSRRRTALLSRRVRAHIRAGQFDAADAALAELWPLDAGIASERRRELDAARKAVAESEPGESDGEGATDDDDEGGDDENPDDDDDDAGFGDGPDGSRD